MKRQSRKQTVTQVCSIAGGIRPQRLTRHFGDSLRKKRSQHVSTQHGFQSHRQVQELAEQGKGIDCKHSPLTVCCTVTLSNMRFS